MPERYTEEHLLPGQSRALDYCDLLMGSLSVKGSKAATLVGEEDTRRRRMRLWRGSSLIPHLHDSLGEKPGLRKELAADPPDCGNPGASGCQAGFVRLVDWCEPLGITCPQPRSPLGNTPGPASALQSQPLGWSEVSSLRQGQHVLGPPSGAGAPPGLVTTSYLRC